MALGCSEHDACRKAAVAKWVDHDTWESLSPERHSVAIRHHWGDPADPPRRRVEGRTQTLLKKYKRWGRQPDAAAWLAPMGLAFSIALTGRDPHKSAILIRHLAEQAGELGFAERVLLPLADKK